MRYSMIRANDRDKEFAYYDIVDNSNGTERVLASFVRYEAAKEITDALNLSYEVQQDQR